MKNHTAGQGPIYVGICHSDLTVTEVREALQAEMTDPDDIIAKERSRRPVRKLGVFKSIDLDDTINDGMPLRKKIRFAVGDGHNLQLWAFNRSGAALTTGSIITALGTLYGRWLR